MRILQYFACKAEVTNPMVVPTAISVVFACKFPVRFLQYFACKSMITNPMLFPNMISAVFRCLLFPADSKRYPPNVTVPHVPKTKTNTESLVTTGLSALRFPAPKIQSPGKQFFLEGYMDCSMAPKTTRHSVPQAAIPCSSSTRCVPPNTKIKSYLKLSLVTA